MEEAFGRRLFALAGAIVSLLALVLAQCGPAVVMHRNIVAPLPILRDNFWLAVHVVTIMASYASAGLALIFGNFALGYYLFGRYTSSGQWSVVSGQCEPASGKTPVSNPQSLIPNPTSPPEACRLLAGFTYTAIQITVLLLAAGTVIGAVWADNAWGHFWGWDPKEVWALVSLLIYLLILHARHAGWSADFGMCLTGVLGAAAIFFTWYGVNYVLRTGMHAYGSSAGGEWATAGVGLLQALFLGAAAARYFRGSSRRTRLPIRPEL